MPKMRKLADLTAEELDEIKSIRQEASTSKAIELREEPSETPSQLSIALDESCVSLTPSLFEGLETQGKNMGILRQVCGVTKEQEEGQQEEEQQTEQQQQQREEQEQQEEEEQACRTPPLILRTEEESEEEFQAPSTASELLSSFRWKCRAAEQIQKVRRSDLLRKKAKYEKDVKRYFNKVCEFQRLLAERKTQLAEVNKQLIQCESSAKGVKELMNKINLV
ncbi:histone H3.v1-like [Zophobas morio]|uniref:histone H3.v1-like n=1 Tax=Zophobas morio TaxID=2755281 RepID=UPI0030831492